MAHTNFNIPEWGARTNDDPTDDEYREVMELIGDRCDFKNWIDDYFDSFFA